jgi:hypothetical protein
MPTPGGSAGARRPSPVTGRCCPDW